MNKYIFSFYVTAVNIVVNGEQIFEAPQLPNFAHKKIFLLKDVFRDNGVNTFFCILANIAPFITPLRTYYQTNCYFSQINDILI